MPDYYVPKARKALAHLQRLLGLNRTDVVNRAVQMYDLIETERANGGEVYIKHGDEYRRLDWE